MNARFVFDSVWQTYRMIRLALREGGGVCALDPTNLRRGAHWRPTLRPQLKDFCSDFVRSGRRALDAPHLASRRILFDTFYVGLAEYHKARITLGVSEMTWVVWTEEIRDLVGHELKDAGMFPIRDYFREPSQQHHS